MSYNSTSHNDINFYPKPEESMSDDNIGVIFNSQEPLQRYEDIINDIKPFSPNYPSIETCIVLLYETMKEKDAYRNPFYESILPEMSFSEDVDPDYNDEGIELKYDPFLSNESEDFQTYYSKDAIIKKYL